MSYFNYLEQSFVARREKHPMTPKTFPQMFSILEEEIGELLEELKNKDSERILEEAIDCIYAAHHLLYESEPLDLFVRDSIYRDFHSHHHDRGLVLIAFKRIEHVACVPVFPTTTFLAVREPVNMLLVVLYEIVAWNYAKVNED